MIQLLCLNLAGADLPKSMAFVQALGFMNSHSFLDLNGHGCGLFDLSASRQL